MNGEITIGYSLSQTGRFAGRGAPWYDNAYRLWAEQTNERGGILGSAIRLITYDDASDADRAAENYRHLIEKDGLRILLGPCHTALTPAILPVIEARQSLFLQGTHGSHADFQTGGRWHFLCWPGCDFDYPKPFLELVAGDIESVAVVYTNGRIGRAVAAGARHHAERLGIQIRLDEEIDDAPIDYDQLMSRVGEADVDALLIGLDHGRSDQPRASCLTAAHRAGISGNKIWHSDFPVIADTELGAANEGVHMRITWVPELSSARSQKFTRDYQTKFNDAPEFHCVGGFACGEVLEQAAAFAGTWAPDEMRNALISERFETIGGSLTFNENGLPNSALRVGRWNDGKLEILDE